MKIELSDNELKEDMKLKISETMEQDFTNFIHDNSDSFN